MLRKVLFTLLLSMSALTVSADGKSKAILDAMTAKMGSYKSYEATFTVRMSDMPDRISGRLIVSGDKYYIAVNGYELFFDGKLRYTYNSVDNEVVIEQTDPADNNLLSNPSRFFRMYNTDFIHTFKGAAGNKEMVELKPQKGVTADYSAITLNIDATTKLPVEVGYKMDDNKTVTDITINKITPNVAVSAATFSFDRSKHKGVEIIDFR